MIVLSFISSHMVYHVVFVEMRRHVGFTAWHSYVYSRLGCFTGVPLANRYFAARRLASHRAIFASYPIAQSLGW